jgi:uncharacterized membrane-anchored protein YhcB (DUF1043 family)
MGLLLSRLTPEVVREAVSVQKELDKRQDETINYYQMRVDKCSYEVQLARRRFMGVDPDNRLVALELESSWNIKLRDLNNARDEYDRQIEKAERERSARDYSLVDNLADRFGEVFRSDSVSCKDKKRMARYLIEDVTLSKVGQDVNIQIRYRGHTTQSVTIPAVKRSYENWVTAPEVVELIRDSAETLFAVVIDILVNKKGFKSGKGCPFTTNIVKRIMYAYSIPNMKERYLDRGYITCVDQASSMGISTTSLMRQIRKDKYRGEYVRVNSRNECVFPPVQLAQNL